MCDSKRNYVLYLSDVNHYVVNHYVVQINRVPLLSLFQINRVEQKLRARELQRSLEALEQTIEHSIQ